MSNLHAIFVAFTAVLDLLERLGATKGMSDDELRSYNLTRSQLRRELVNSLNDSQTPISNPASNS